MTRLWPAGEAVEIWGDEETPRGFLWRGNAHQIVHTGNRWRIHTRWWEPAQAIWREYTRVTTDTGILCILYRDLAQGGWFLTRVYD
jgi:hypothetical protein